MISTMIDVAKIPPANTEVNEIRVRNSGGKRNECARQNLDPTEAEAAILWSAPTANGSTRAGSRVERGDL